MQNAGRTRSVHADDGISLIEIMVAMMIFSIIALGIGYAMISTLTIARDNKSREIAAGIAASEIDSARAIGDPFAVLDVAAHTVTTAAAETYTVTRITAWVTPAGSSTTCGTGGGALQYKRITITVSWPKMRSADPVTSDTLLAPSSRINDPAKGTLLISVKDSRGLGKPGVTFTAVSPTGSLVTTPTDADGCSFVLQASPDDYTVKLTGTGMVDSTQAANPAITLPVAAGSSTSYSFQYDAAATYNVHPAFNVPTPLPKIPTNLDYSFINSYGAFVMRAPTNSVKMHPYPVGYQTIAGKYAATACPTVDPEAWAPDTTVTPAKVGVRQPVRQVDPGAAADIYVPMGAVVLSGGPSAYLTAVSQPDVPIAGEPVCASSPTTTMTYSFGSIVPSASGSVRIALPFGSWKLYTSTSPTGTLTLIPNSRITSFLTTGRSVSPPADGLFALDAR
ncbi:type IV pilus modification PilV family protein [Cryobacterium arcticum]|nr:type II secretion system protein [Cryobacterium arcticum]